MHRGWAKDPETGAPPQAGFAGCFDFLDEGSGLRGWIVNLGRTDESPQLEVWCGRRLLSLVASHGERPDIDAALGVSGRFGFLIPWDSFDLDEVYAAEEEAPDAPIFIACPKAGQIVPPIGETILVKVLAARLAATASVAPSEPGDEDSLLGRLISRLSRDARPGRDEDEGVDAHVAEVTAADGLAEDTLADPTDVRSIDASHDASIAAQDLPPRRVQIEQLRASGLFDETFYASHNPDVVEAQVPLLEHYFDNGWREGRNPNPMFESAYYLAQNPDVATAEVQPLWHYLHNGDREGRRPCAQFDPGWYRGAFGMEPDQNCLAHYLANRVGGRVSPIAEFDIAYYLDTYPDIAAAGIDPYLHFMEAGHREGRNPSAEFDTQFYRRRYLKGDLDENPLLHWMAHRGEAGVHPRMPEDEVTTHREIRRFAKAGPEFETFRALPPSAPRLAKVLAYYLPQFHAFPENDRWWGTGFTEWTNIQRGVPRFRGHYQPRVPRDLGHYSLEGTEVMRRQAQMAKAGGVHGFVFYYYWFNGKRLLERPVEAFLADPSIDMPFALMWANENWTRRWDGFESEVLISQDYRPDDDVRMAEEFARHFRDKRYIRVQGRPLLMIYRPRLIPDTKATVARWRSLFRESFNEDPVLIMAQGFGDEDPAEFGLDGAIEFPPHKVAMNLRNMIGEIDLLDPDFSGHVISYDRVVENSLAAPTPAFPLIKGATPSWDNDARRQGTGMVLQNSTPAKYETWLAALVERAVAAPFMGEPMVVVNAWNEWAEGAYLEPDQHYGAAYLNATARAVTGASKATGRPAVLLVGHDAHPHGAQELLWNIGRTLRRRFGAEIEYLLLDGGDLVRRYEEIAPTAVLPSAKELDSVLSTYHARGFRSAIVNTSAAAHVVKPAASIGIAATQLVHELPRIIGDMKLAPAVRDTLAHARQVVFPGGMVRDAVVEAVGGSPPEAGLLVRPQGLYKSAIRSEADGARIRSTLGIKPDERLVLCIGFADLRKGFDLFLQGWRLMRASPGSRVHFCWAGKVDNALRNWLGQELDAAVAEGSFHLPGFTSEVSAYLSAANAFALTSREDPFPSVALEAMSVGMPVVAFGKSGGVPELLAERGIGRVVPYGDVPAMVKALEQEMAPGALDSSAAQARRKLMAEEFVWDDYVGDLLKLALPDLRRVSVTVPNYNYARYMPERLGSIFGQAYPVLEVIVLDDCSKDDSLEAIERVAAEWHRDVRLLANTVNSGSVFAQWRKAAEEATGEFVWIAEADDVSDPTFISKLVDLLRSDPEIRFAFSDSRAVDSDGKSLGASYKPYYATVEPGALEHTEVFDADDFVRRFLSVKNLILNVSAVVWRRDALLRALDRCGAELKEYRMAGDWRLYLEALAEPGARIAYEAEPLNVHRRHAQSVTHALKADLHVAEIDRIQGMAAQAFGLPPAAVATQRAYLEEVSVQLGGRLPAQAATPTAPTAQDRSAPPATAAD
ncbi:glycoside hydrolase family 99-like domain-containing protein [Roseomonas sp. CECT 9278]|uniref:glycoside hydrolase family 99-like domain-containing protein n=1 Tax=Roseomonas sp. CECT 9278 TaxID=2845823 RepID=UPI001E50D675|nr:glycoside hydrolase family 99-like domain-containing protein [Roseomonas sp. CECT 9278]CAH0306313.1 D-inositol-3-phosphate glycosyltransferase [Roseomonas sp. CECT 9278]